MMSTPTGIFSTAGFLDQRRDLLGVALHQAERRIDGAAQADQAGLAVLRLEPGRVELVVHGGRAEIPQDRIVAGARDQRPAAQLVALPLADLGRGAIADVVDVEHEQRAELGFLQRLLHAAKPVAMQPPVIDPLLEVDAHDAERRQRPAPIVARVDVLGADRRRVAGDVVHGELLTLSSVILRCPPQAGLEATTADVRQLDRFSLSLRARLLTASDQQHRFAAAPCIWERRLQSIRPIHPGYKMLANSVRAYQLEFPSSAPMLQGIAAVRRLQEWNGTLRNKPAPSLRLVREPGTTFVLCSHVRRARSFVTRHDDAF